MTRKIKYRGIIPGGIYTQTGQVIMSEVASIDFMNDEVYFELGGDVACKIDEANLMQYTGLKDKNGKEIFEGDIVKSDGRNYGGSYFHVNFNHGSFGIQHNNTDTWISCAIPCFQEREVFVIGNIYENPELLDKTD